MGARRVSQCATGCRHGRRGHTAPQRMHDGHGCQPQGESNGTGREGRVEEGAGCIDADVEEPTPRTVPVVQVHALQQVSEILLHREPTLLNKFAGELVPFQVDPCAPVRKFLAGFAESCCTKHPQLLATWLPVLGVLLEDPQGTVAKKACLSCTALAKVCLRYINEQGNKPKSRVTKNTKETWTNFRWLKEKLVQKAMGKDGQSLQMHAIKFCEVIIMTYTSVKKQGKEEDFIASRISPKNSLLKQADLQEEAIQMLTKLSELMKAENGRNLPGPVVIVLINLLSGVAKNRTDLEHLCLPALIELANSDLFDEPCNSSQIASAKHALKTGLDLIARSKVHEHAYWHPKILQALNKLGDANGKEDGKDSARTASGKDAGARDKRKGGTSQMNEHEDMKRTKFDGVDPPTDSGKVYPRTDQVQLEQILILLAGLAKGSEFGKIHTFIDNMSPVALADVVIHNMRYLTSNLAAAVATGMAGEPAVANPLSQLVAAQTIEKATDEAAQVEEDVEAVDVEAVATDTKSLSGGEGVLTAFVAEPPDVLHTPDYVSHLNSEDIAALGRAAVSRIVGVQFGDKSSEFLKHGILIDLALDEEVGGEGNAQVVLEYALGDWYGRYGHELLVRWLSALFLKFCGKDLKNDGKLLEGSERLNAVKYDAILSAACEGLLERLSPKDKALSQLLMEVPWVTKSAVDVVADICQFDKQNTGGWSVLGLTVLRDLILSRPLVREDALNYVLEFTADLDPAMRSRAIRLTVNILFPMDHIKDQIEVFAESLLKTAELKEEIIMGSTAEKEDDAAEGGWEKDEEGMVVEEDKPGKPTLAEVVESRISLFMALCTKKHTLLLRLAESFSKVDSHRQEIIGKNVPGLVRTISDDVDVFLQLLKELPDGAEDFARSCLYCLSEVGPLAAPLKEAVVAHYERSNDPRLLPPACSSMTKKEFLGILPAIVRDLDPLAIHNALIIAMGGRPVDSLDQIQEATAVPARACIDPPEILIFLHMVDLERHELPLKKVVEACNYCFALKGIFQPELLAIATQRLSDERTLPLLLMRTVIQTLSVAPTLKRFIVNDILPKLVNKQVWKVPQLWQGFVRCCQQTAPDSYPILLQLPAPQLSEVLEKVANLKSALASYARKARVGLSAAHRELLGLDR